jgi:hypothetical protein
MDEEDPVDLKPQIEEAARPLCARVSKFVHMFVPSLCTYASIRCAFALTRLPRWALNLFLTNQNKMLCASRYSRGVHFRLNAHDANECIVHFDVSTLSLTSQSQQWQSYMACTERVKADKTGEAHCTGQYLDFWACLDS